MESDTGLELPAEEERAVSEALRTFAASAVFVARLALRDAGAATTTAMRRCVLELTAATRAGVSVAASSTELEELAPQAKARLEAILAAAANDLIEDGMCNAVTDRLPELITSHYTAVIPALGALLDAGQTSAAVAAEVLKELGRHADPASHELRRWLLEHELFSSDPTTRDGAGLGLARLRDGRAVAYLREAIAREPLPQLRADLGLVLDELDASGTQDAGTPSGHHQS